MIACWLYLDSVPPPPKKKLVSINNLYYAFWDKFVRSRCNRINKLNKKRHLFINLYTVHNEIVISICLKWDTCNLITWNVFAHSELLRTLFVWLHEQNLPYHIFKKIRILPHLWIQKPDCTKSNVGVKILLTFNYLPWGVFSSTYQLCNNQINIFDWVRHQNISM